MTVMWLHCKEHKLFAVEWCIYASADWLGHHWSRWWACCLDGPIHYLNQCLACSHPWQTGFRHTAVSYHFYSDVSLPVARPRQPRCHHVEDMNSRLTMSVSTVEPTALCCLNCQVTALTLPQICWPRPVPLDRRGLFNHRTLVKLRKFADFWPSYFIHWPSSVDPDTDSATNQSDGFTVSHPSLPSFVNKNGDPARVDSLRFPP